MGVSEIAKYCGVLANLGPDTEFCFCCETARKKFELTVFRGPRNCDLLGCILMIFCFFKIELEIFEKPLEHPCVLPCGEVLGRADS